MSRILFFTALLFTIISTASNAREPSDHWSFLKLSRVEPPVVGGCSRVETPVDNFILAKLEERGLSFNSRPDPATLLRRLSFDLTGLPPTPEETADFLFDKRPDAWPQAVERLLASPCYGERWGKMWLDAVGYADSNGYFDADTDRPLAFKYRDYVISAFNMDKPFDRFVREQLAGDEIAGYSKNTLISPETIELLTATHFLRNSQDGSSESDGNPDEVTIDRATVLEGTLQITMNTLLGVTIQCARCHEHKFEPIDHAEYYQLQSIFYPAFPYMHRDKWIGPVERVSHVATKTQLGAWKHHEKQLDDKIAALRNEFDAWINQHRPPGAIIIEDGFDDPSANVAANWSLAVPRNSPSGTARVKSDSNIAPGARVRHGALELLGSGSTANRLLATKRTIDWTPSREGEWMQVTFDLINDKLDPSGTPAERIGYYIALHDYDDDSPRRGGNILIDGNPAGGAELHLDYPEEDQESTGTIGTSGYRPGRNYGVRITNAGENRFRVEQLVDSLPEEKTITLEAEDIPDGGFGFEFCCGRSFIVDNVVIESVASHGSKQHDNAILDYSKQHQTRSSTLAKAIAAMNAVRNPRPGKLAWISDLVTPPPDVFRLEGGSYAEPAEKVIPGPLSVLTSDQAEFQLPTLPKGAASSGRRLAFANWITRSGSRSSALLARVMVNRIWKHHFGRGLVATLDNFGESGSSPSHPELLEYLADQFVRSGWSIKATHRLILNSAVYQQASTDNENEFHADPDNLLLARFPLRRLDAESIRDAMLAISGEIDQRHDGPYVPTTVLDDGNVVVDGNHADSRRRGIYLQQRRTRMNSLLALFDAPAMVHSCGQRNTSTVPLQSLALLNSIFVRDRSAALAQRIAAAASDQAKQIELAIRLSYCRPPTIDELQSASEFLQTQREVYQADGAGSRKALTDLCQMLFASNAFLYIE